MSKNVTAMKSRTVYSVEGLSTPSVVLPVHVVENTDASGTDIQVIFQRKNGTWRAPLHKMVLCTKTSARCGSTKVFASATPDQHPLTTCSYEISGHSCPLYLFPKRRQFMPNSKQRVARQKHRRRLSRQRSQRREELDKCKWVENH